MKRAKFIYFWKDEVIAHTVVSDEWAYKLVKEIADSPKGSPNDEGVLEVSWHVAN